MKSLLHLWLWIWLSSQCVAEDPISVTLEEGRPREYFGRLHVGSVENGTSRNIPFRLSHPSGSEILLHDPKGTCGCIQVEMSSTKIEPGKSVDGMLVIKVDAKREPVWRQRLTFDPEKFGDAYVQLEVVSDISGFLAFHDREVLVQLFASSHGKDGDSSGLIHKLLPFSASPPIVVDELELSVVPGHPGVKAEFARTPEGEHAVRIAIDAVTIIGASPVSVLCQLRDKESNKVADVRVIIAERSPISVVPSTVRFSRGKDGHLIGHAIVARHYLKDESEEARSDSPLIAASLLDTSLTVTTSPISRSVIRATVQIPESIEEGLAEGDSQMVWNVLWGGDRVTCGGKIYLSPTSIVQE